MKTIKSIFYAMMLLAGVSCIKDEQEKVSPETENSGIPSFVAVGSRIGSPVPSKVSLKDNGTSVRWERGDLVAVSDGSGDIYKFASEGEETDVVFRYQSQDGQECMFNKSADRYMMVYPWTESVTMDMENGTVTSRLPAVQTAVKGNFQGPNAVAVATGSDLVTPFTFKCAVTMLKVEIPEELGGMIAELVVRGNQGEDLAGDLVVLCSDNGPVTTLGTKKYSEVKLIPEDGCLEPGTYYIAIAPVTVSKGICVAAVSAENFTEFEISTAKAEKTFRPGYIYNLGTLDAGKIDFPTGLGRLPYVFSLFATAGTGNQLKYLTKTVVTDKTRIRLTDAETGSVLDVRSTGTLCDYWSNKWYGQDNIVCDYFNTEDTYFMLSIPLKMSLPASFRVSFGHFTEPAHDIVKDWKVQYSKDQQSWYDGACYEFQRILKYYSVEITPEVNFGEGDVLYLRWVPVGNASWSGGTTDGLKARVQFASGIVISDVMSPDSDASGNVYSEDFDRIRGGVDYRHAGRKNGIEKLGLLGEMAGDKIDSWTDEQKNGLEGSFVAERPGYVQIGMATYANDNRNGAGTNNVGSLITPPLAEASGTLTLSFKAMCYRSPFIGRAGMSANAQADVTDIVVRIKGAGSFNPSAPVTSLTIGDISTSRFDTKTLTIYNSDATTRIEFTSAPVDRQFTRWFLDDICISK